MHRGNVVHLARTIACAAAAAILVALPAAASDRDRDDGRGRGGSHQHGKHDVEELAAELKALKARVRKLEGHLTSEDVAGTYTWRHVQAALISVAPPQVSRVEHLASVGILQLNANGTFSYSGRESGFNAIWQFPTNRERVDRADGASGTWTYIDNVLYLSVDGGEANLPFGGAVGGRLFIYAGSNPADGTRTIVTLVKRND